MAVLRAGMAIRAPICLTRTSEFLSLMNPFLTQMLGESASVEMQASEFRCNPPVANARWSDTSDAGARPAVFCGPNIGHASGNGYASDYEFVAHRAALFRPLQRVPVQS